MNKIFLLIIILNLHNFTKKNQLKFLIKFINKLIETKND